MAMNTKFLTTTSTKLPTIDIINGQIIALSDTSGWYYDMGDARHAITGNSISTELPASGKPDTLYAVNSSDANISGVYIWDGSQFVKICGLDNEKVKVTSSESTKVYLVGTVSGLDGAQTLVKNSGIYVDLVTGETTLAANSAKSAVNDSEGNPINETYIKSITATKDSNVITFILTKGDNTTTTLQIEDYDTTYSPFRGVNGQIEGASGLVPGPKVADANKFLKSDGTWAEVATIDTKNTTGATPSTEKLYVIGAPNQGENPESYTNEKVYVGTDNHIYSNDKQVVNLSDVQALTNKTYEGFTLGNVVEKDLSPAITEDDIGVPTSDLVYAAINQILADAKSYTDSAISGVAQFNIEVVDELPNTDIKDHTIYLVPSDKADTDNVKVEYLYINNSWEMIGSTAIDLSGYPTAEQMNTAISSAIAGKADSSDLADYLPLAGGTMTGDIAMNNNGISGIAQLNEVSISAYLKNTGNININNKTIYNVPTIYFGNITDSNVPHIISDTSNVLSVYSAGINVNDSKITGVTTPTANTDAANKQYVDTAVIPTATLTELASNDYIVISDTSDGGKLKKISIATLRTALGITYSLGVENGVPYIESIT